MAFIFLLSWLYNFPYNTIQARGLELTMISNFGFRKNFFSLLNISNSKVLSVGILVTSITLTGCLSENTSKSGVEKRDSDKEFE